MKKEYEHPAFPQPANPGVSIWRYLDFKKFDWLLNCHRLFMPSADRLGDPLEGTQPNGDLEWWKRLAASAKSEEQRQIIQQNRVKILRFAKAFRPHYYVSCWHMNQAENDKMWSCYTKSPDAVAIRTTYYELRQLLPEYVDLGMVRYIDYATDRLPTLNMFQYITHKNINYSFEREVRTVAFPPPTDTLGKAHFQENLFELEQTPSFHFYAPSINVSRLVHAVVLHPRATAIFNAKVVDICKKVGLPRPSRS